MIVPIPCSVRYADALCRTFGALSVRTWIDLRDSRALGHSLSEESLTDLLVLDIGRLHRSEVIIKKFTKRDEGRTTGADWEWWFVKGGVGFGMRVQAKKVGDDNNYPGLPKPLPKSRRLQVNLLIRDAERRGLYPIYCFYNYWDSNVAKNLLCGALSPRMELWGCSIADAYAVKRKISRKEISVEDIAPISLPWTCLVCCTFSPNSGTVLPERVRNIVAGVSGSVNRRRTVPGVTENLPRYVTNLIRFGAEAQRFSREQLGFEGDVDGIMVFQEREALN